MAALWNLSTFRELEIRCSTAADTFEYGTLREWAKTLKNEEAHVLLSEILDMEKAANNKLNAIAINSLNKD